MRALTETEKNDLLRSVKSKDLRDEFRKIKKNGKKFGSADEFIEFLNFTNSFCNHSKRNVKKIKENIFIL